jgi:(S)-ureidoglycine---glyoxylate transaminase
MALADLDWPLRLLAGGGPSSPDPRVLRAMSLPLIGQFDPEFTALMDEVMRLARTVFLTNNERCFPVSGLGLAGLEAVLNTLVEEGDPVAVMGGPRFAAEAADIAERYGAELVGPDENPKVLVVPLIDPDQSNLYDVHELAEAANAVLVVEAGLGLGACELRVDDWGIDACVAGVEYGIGAPAGMSLVTYSPAVEAVMRARRSAPSTSFLDLLQLQAYWSPERLNHHTAPTSLVYGLREALRLVQAEGLMARWERHAQIGHALRDGLRALGLRVSGDGPYAIVHLSNDRTRQRERLRDEYGVHVTQVAADTWRMGLLGADARPETLNQVLAALEKVLAEA